MTRKILLSLFCFGVVTILAIWTAQQSSKHSLLQSPNGLGFPFEIKHEGPVNSLLGVRWEATIIIANEHYNKKNLDRIFSWYASSKHNDKSWLEVKVYTDVNNLPNPASSGPDPLFYTPVTPVTPVTPITPDPSAEVNSAGQARRRPYDAVFWKQSDRTVVSGSESMWYSYSPDLKNPNSTKTIVLKGKAPHALRQPIEDWETSSQALTIKASAYELKNTEPSGVYYTFYFAASNSDDWKEIVTLRQDERHTIPKRQVRFVTDRFVFVFLGWKYVATVDSGQTWFGWDAERDIPGYHCCDQKLIRDVQIASDGSGTMTLVSDKLTSQIPPLLRTKDFGKHWSAE